ncbi:hypothetical protein Phum_PHUM548410 [Pediculus humanus corporis]|uniref:Uncharacterized protein n=1 Tax=Pediculus humanus subsp. corporis TaxID=121224 RepID=E0W0A4_PEDHC|nr:uncharacterized protein Phum_PHUM548410 [Pediculus humanus corporis]EEB19060.1 hypothetical protein Phum_PHUM548410 [Pediculus humanus corporis]
MAVNADVTVRREVPWHLVPNVPRPSQVPPCYTAFGSKGFPVCKEGAVTCCSRPARTHRRYLYATLY